jgi:exonuclease SbcD
MLISGNHDSAQRVNVFRQVLSNQKIHLIGLPPMEEDESITKVTMQDEYGDIHFYLLPFVKPSMVKTITGTDENGNNLSYDAALHALVARETLDQTQRNVLVSHQFYLSTGSSADEITRSDSEIITVGNIDSINGDLLEQFDYAALGHIHKPQKLNGKDCYRYCGTPLSCSVSEAGQEKAIIEVDIGPKGEVRTAPLLLHPLHAVRKIQDTLANVLGGDKAPEDIAVTLAVMKLPQKLREVITLYYYQGYNTREIAQIVRATQSTVARRLKKARALLYAELTEEQ